MDNSMITPATAKNREQYIVAIGASAGGLEAIQEFFDNMPSGGNLSYVVIQHLSPDFKSLLVELLSRHTHMKVVEAEHDLPVTKDYIYVIPNDKVMTIKNGRLQLNKKPADKLPNTAIDKFLLSLADDIGSRSIAIILSGTGTDGTKGIEAIKKTGGLVIVQDPTTAKFDGMPNSAIASDNVDFIMAPELMAEEIFTYIHEIPVQVLNKGKVEEELLSEIFRIIHTHCGHDFNSYKYPTILRRIAQRMTISGFSKLKDYVDHLRSNPEECKTLYKDFLIGVTRFYRDKVPFEIISNEVLPAIFNNKAEGEVIKVWVTACSTGEEAYSIAMLFNEYQRSNDTKADVKIFATDADPDAIKTASGGVYSIEIEKDLDPTLLERYFTRDENGYTVNPAIRKQIVFAKHNLVKDPPFIKMDLVTCRNMLIYMNNGLQKKVLSALHFSLHAGGFLLLGNSENISPIREYMDDINNKWKIYRKNNVSRIYSRDESLNRLEPIKNIHRPNEFKEPLIITNTRKNADILSGGIL